MEKVNFYCHVSLLEGTTIFGNIHMFIHRSLTLIPSWRFDTLPKTNSLPQKMMVSNRYLRNSRGLFSRDMLVSGRVSFDPSRWCAIRTLCQHLLQQFGEVGAANCALGSRGVDPEVQDTLGYRGGCNQGYFTSISGFMGFVCPLTRVINLHITMFLSIMNL